MNCAQQQQSADWRDQAFAHHLATLVEVARNAGTQDAFFGRPKNIERFEAFDQQAAYLRSYAETQAELDS